MAFTCPQCGAVAKTRTSEMMSEETRRSYHQCQNILCGCTFTTITTIERYLTRPTPQKLPTDFNVPKLAFPSSHYGDEQIGFGF
ncbi:ogr/Delta-like zinc finger family protein [Xenorhabdus bovienii]|uniref:ogr/Delta-like zinc finger family protein n=1 Tax=Xenorhabdus bovienii TaxID=40576 RepID=UPI0023B27B4E|nr:ogr/Delta-like zinc finger family protein [Xenorhabdus bovienii]MDE9494107.1 ogr/Delta-like zinc finger family protein [Xenorhabdus bovienii]MDE9502644.1 ogr/Delta-like zinc finger family protein [Xenorhabdus bovienii]MDE9525341.1 ogr/Delta-like zinc finger family protein [Xenorhabdus bovienii]MDE9544966.1 ogr/Delta-like zinc finger family protein [Xenorhabdus bovienii]MDE9566141.1 ogr/Delta-like zinc finger family protein [Xenorhabdus bovienii]